MPRPATVLCLVLALAGCGDSSGELREWRAEDHGQPEAGEIDPARVPDEPSGTTEERAVAALWTVSCATCHGRDGRGNGPGLPPNAQARDLTDPEWQAGVTDEEIADVITNGRGMMPRFGDQVNSRGIAALVGHVRRLGGP